MRTCVFFLTLLTAGSVLGQAPCYPPEGRSVSVTGTAKIAVRPDRVSFTLGVQTEGLTVSEVFRKNNEKLNSVVDALRARGVQPEEMQTSNFMIATTDEMGVRIKGFRATNQVTITTKDPAAVSELLELGVAKGANQAGELRFFAANNKTLQDRGLDLAFADARAKAEKLARLFGSALGGVICAWDYGGGGGPIPAFISAPPPAIGRFPAIEMGLEELHFGVTVMFELK